MLIHLEEDYQQALFTIVTHPARVRPARPMRTFSNRAPKEKRFSEAITKKPLPNFTGDRPVFHAAHDKKTFVRPGRAGPNL